MLNQEEQKSIVCRFCSQPMSRQGHECSKPCQYCGQNFGLSKLSYHEEFECQTKDSFNKLVSQLSDAEQQERNAQQLALQRVQNEQHNNQVNIQPQNLQPQPQQQQQNQQQKDKSIFGNLTDFKNNIMSHLSDISNQIFQKEEIVLDHGLDQLSKEQQRQVEEMRRNKKKNEITDDGSQAHYIYKNNNKEKINCGICYDLFRNGDKIKTIPCLHQFHFDCLNEWLIKSNECPYCKSNIV